MRPALRTLGWMALCVVLAEGTVFVLAGAVWVFATLLEEG